MNSHFINDIIQNRRSVFPSQYNGSNVSNEIIQDLLNNANMAPTHKLTQPWRFKVLQKKAKNKLGDFLSELYFISTDPKSFSKFKQNKIKEKCLLSSAIIVICMQRDLNSSVPEWEEIASTSMAVQNMWLTCTANNVGCYWSSPKSIEKIGNFINLSIGERCLGFMYLGNYNSIENTTSKRDSINSKVEWIDSFDR
jgi:nitroreductase|tara:strand:- start:2710 stop:3297 length:588 start_codon:yes stop_codon:yes gene_type:complete